MYKIVTKYVVGKILCYRVFFSRDFGKMQHTTPKGGKIARKMH